MVALTPRRHLVTEPSRASVSEITPSGGEKRTLGRYQIEKELGKGATGIVYLGSDPKIGRVVAIKILVLSREFEACAAAMGVA